MLYSLSRKLGPVNYNFIVLVYFIGEFEIISIVTKYLWIKKYAIGPLVCYFVCCVTKQYYLRLY